MKFQPGSANGGAKSAGFARRCLKGELQIPLSWRQGNPLFGSGWKKRRYSARLKLRADLVSRLTQRCNMIALVFSMEGSKSSFSMNRKVNDRGRSLRKCRAQSAHTALPGACRQPNHLMPCTRSLSSTLRVLEIRNRASTETVRCPFSIKEMNTTDSPVFSAMVSWVSFARLRCTRMASPKTRRCKGTDGTLDSSRPWTGLTFTIV